LSGKRIANLVAKYDGGSVKTLKPLRPLFGTKYDDKRGRNNYAVVSKAIVRLEHRSRTDPQLCEQLASVQLPKQSAIPRLEDAG